MKKSKKTKLLTSLSSLAVVAGGVPATVAATKKNDNTNKTNNALKTTNAQSIETLKWVKRKYFDSNLKSNIESVVYTDNNKLFSENPGLKSSITITATPATSGSTTIGVNITASGDWEGTVSWNAEYVDPTPGPTPTKSLVLNTSSIPQSVNKGSGKGEYEIYAYVKEGSTVSPTPASIANVTVTVPEAQQSILTATGNTSDSRGFVDITPSSTTTGAASLSITVTDTAGNMGSAVVQVIVKDTEPTPTKNLVLDTTSIPQSITAGSGEESYEVFAYVNDGGELTEANIANVKVTVPSSQQTILTASGSAAENKGYVNITPSTSTTGTAKLTITVTDDQGNTGVSFASVTVKDAEPEPTPTKTLVLNTSNIPQTVYNGGTQESYQIYAYESDGETISPTPANITDVIVTIPEAQQSILTATGSAGEGKGYVNIKPSESTTGTALLAVTVADDNDNIGTSYVTVKVASSVYGNNHVTLNNGLVYNLQDNLNPNALVTDNGTLILPTTTGHITVPVTNVTMLTVSSWNEDITELTDTENGEGFLSGCSNLTYLKLDNSSNTLGSLKKLGNNFLKDCSKLTSVGLSGLTGVEEIGDDFMSGCTNMSTVDFSTFGNVTKIGDNFLKGCASITGTVSLSIFGQTLTSIGNYFMSGCENVTEVTMPLTKLETIGTNFLDGCEDIKTINLADCDVLASIDDDFLNGCASVNKLVLPKRETSAIPELKSWGTNIANAESDMMITVDCGSGTSTRNYYDDASAKWSSLDEMIEKNSTPALRKLVNWVESGINKVLYTDDNGDNTVIRLIDEVDPNVFVDGYYDYQTYTLPIYGETSSSVTIYKSSIVALAITGCSSLYPQIYSNYYYGFLDFSNVIGGSNIVDLDLSGLKHITNVGDFFMRSFDNEKLHNIDLSFLSNVKTIGSYFMSNCNYLTSFDSTPLAKVESIGDYFVSNCPNLTELDLDGLNMVTSVTNYFLYNCPNLREVNVTGLNSLSSIGNYFLYNYSNLEYVNLSGLKSVEAIGDCFLCNCPNLTNVVLSEGTGETATGLISVEYVGDYFLAYNKNLTNVELRLPKAQTIGEGCLRTCENLRVIDMEPLVTVSSEGAIGDGFAMNCPRLEKIYTGHLQGAHFAMGTYGYSFAVIPSDEEAEWSGFEVSAPTRFNKGVMLDVRNEDYQNNALSIMNTYKYVYEKASYWTGTVDCYRHLVPKGSSYVIGDTESVDYGKTEMLISYSQESFDELSIPSTVQSVSFNQELDYVTSIKDYFLCSSTPGESYASLTSVNLEGLSNVKQIGNYFLDGCSALPEVDLSFISKGTSQSKVSVGNYFLANCTSLTTIYAPSMSPQDITWAESTGVSTFMYNSSATGTLHAESTYLSLYKGTAPWSSLLYGSGRSEEFDWKFEK